MAEQSKKEMLSVSEENGVTKVSINSSSLALLLECPRKSYYTLTRGLKHRHPNPATSYGSAIHAALETFYKGKPAERKMPAKFEEKMADLEFNYIEEQDNLLLRAGAEFVRQMDALRELEAEDKRSVSAGLWTLTHYFKTYIDDPYEVLHDETGPITERTVRYVLHSEDKLQIEYFGQIDVILKHTVTGNVLVADHKTSSIVGAQFFNRLKPNHQYTGYVLGARRVLGLDTNAFLVNCIQVKSKPKTARGSAPNFPRQVTTRDDGDFLEFEKTVVTAVRQYLQWIAEDFFPMGHANACAAYTGCQFLEVCGSPESIRENILDAKFEEA